MRHPIIICEDHLPQLQQLETLIRNHLLFQTDFFHLDFTTQSPVEVTHYLTKFCPIGGLYFLDIDLNHTMSGIDLAEVIRKADVQAKLVFITSHEELAPLTLKRKVEALGFIAKDQPLDNFRADIVEVLSLAQERLTACKLTQKQVFSFSIGSQTFMMDLAEVIFIEPSPIPHRLTLHTQNGQYEFYGKLTNIEETYPILVRVSRSCLINPLSVTEIDYSHRLISFGKDVSRSFPLGKAKQIKRLMDNAST